MASFYLDNDLARELATRLRNGGHDVTTVRALGLGRAGDDEHFLRAAQDGRVLVTHNGQDFILRHNAWCRWTASWGVAARHAGVLVLPQVLPAISESAILTLLNSGHPLANRLYEWIRGRGWAESP